MVLASCESAIEACSADKMHFRPPHEMNTHKVTCGVHVDVVAEARQLISEALGRSGVQAKLITSGKGDWRYLDIVPEGAGKLESLEFIREQFAVPHEQTVACGDSGNDIAMFEGANLSIVVGNAQPDLVTWLEENMPGIPPTSTGQARILHATQSVADGILEGLQHFQLY